MQKIHLVTPEFDDDETTNFGLNPSVTECLLSLPSSPKLKRKKSLQSIDSSDDEKSLLEKAEQELLDEMVIHECFIDNSYDHGMQRSLREESILEQSKKSDKHITHLITFIKIYKYSFSTCRLMLLFILDNLLEIRLK